MKKGNKLYSIFSLKCPCCHKGPLFTCNNPYKITKLGKMYPECPCCSQPYTPEPGFYFGAAYVSYFLNVIIFGAGLITLLMFTHVREPLLMVIILSLLILLFVPLTFVLSRSIWINIFIGYRKDMNGMN